MPFILSCLHAVLCGRYSSPSDSQLKLRDIVLTQTVLSNSYLEFSQLLVSHQSCTHGHHRLEKSSTLALNAPSGTPPGGAKSEDNHMDPPERVCNEDGDTEDAVRQSTEREFHSALPESCHIPYLNSPQESEDAGHANSPPISHFHDVNSGSWRDAPNSRCHASFGDQGATATVGAFGQLLQFSTFLGVGSSGVFSADHISTHEPYEAFSRARDLQQLSDQPFHFGPTPPDDPSYGLKFPDLILKLNAEPHLTWTNWRWPRYVYSRGDFESHPNLELTIQWMIHEKTVLQHCIFQNYGNESVRFEVGFSKSMVIRDLDYHDPQLSFNKKEAADRDIRVDPEVHGRVCVKSLNPSSTENPRSIPEKSGGISVIGALAIDSEVHRLGDNVSQRWKVDLRPPASDDQPQILDMTAAYRMQHLTIPIADWEIPIIPLADMKVTKFLREQQSAQRPPVGPPRSLREATPDMAYTKKQNSSNMDGTNDFEHIGLTIDNTDGVTAPNQIRPFPTEPPVGTPGASLSPQNHLDFATRRNLEHILSVCAVPATPEGDSSSLPKALRGVTAFALTCGDLSGHRICWSASL